MGQEGNPICRKSFTESVFVQTLGQRCVSNNDEMFAMIQMTLPPAKTNGARFVVATESSGAHGNICRVVDPSAKWGGTSTTRFPDKVVDELLMQGRRR